VECGLQDHCCVPEPIEGMVTPRVLCMSFEEGFKVTDDELLGLWGINVKALLHKIVCAYSQQL